MKESVSSVHEASHALIAHKLGQRVLKLSIENGEKGFCDYEINMNCPITIATIILAGHESEILWFDAEPEMFPEEDLKHLEEISVSITGCNIIRDPIIAFLKEHEYLIGTIASVLDRKKKIDRKEFLNIVK